MVRSFALLALCCLSGLAAAQVVEEIVVIARGVEERVRDIPVAMSVVSEERLENLDLSSLEDIAQVTPQLNIVRAGSGSGTSVSIRGIGSSSTSIGIEQSVSTIIDGVYFPQGRVINESMFDLRQLAILKGPQALFFGKNATAGVVAVETNDPGQDVELIGKASYELEQEKQVYEAILSGPLTDNFGARLALRTSDMNEGYLRDLAGATTYTTLDAATFTPTVHANPALKQDQWPAEESLYGRLTLTYQATDSLGFKLKASHAEFEISSPNSTELWSCPALDGVPHMVEPVTGLPVPNVLAECRADRATSSNPVPPDIAATNPLLRTFGHQLGEDYESDAVTLSTELALDRVEIAGILNYHTQETRWVGDFDGGGSTAVFAGENNEFDNLSLELRAVTQFDGPFNFVGGVYLQETERKFYQDVAFAGAENSAAAHPADVFTAYQKVSETDGETASVYGELQWDLADRWRLTAGLRYIDESKDSFFAQPYVNPFFVGIFTAGRVEAAQDFEETTPEVTLRWEATDNLTVYAAYKEGFKSGGFSNSGILSAIAGSVEDFTFEPEKVDGWELGLKGSLFDDTLEFEFEVYQYDFDDLQIDFFNSPSFAFITTNAGGSKTDGAELQLSWAPPVEGLVVHGALAYNNSEYTDFLAPCYAGQRPSQGCTIQIPGQVPQQQIAGTDRALAPKFSGYLGADYERTVFGNLLLGLTLNYQFKDDHHLNAFGHPADRQNAYETLDAAIRLGSQDRRWQLAFIGRNITDEYALLASGDTPSTGGGTGTEGGFPADRTGTPIVGETYQLELTVRY
jgi:outer membrane receptor protein involved in Fe transport